MFARPGKCFVIALLVMTTGAHWVLLQTAAWTTMFAANLGSETFSAAVAKTFDGKHPCRLCKAIAAGKKSEQKKESAAQTLKLEFPPAAEGFVLVSPRPFSAFSLAAASAEVCSQKPPLPPPRGFFI